MNPPDQLLGVSYAKQAQYIGEASLGCTASRVDMLIHFMARDDPLPRAGRAASRR